MANEEIKDQDLTKAFDEALSRAPEEAKIAVDPCVIYRLIPQSLKEKFCKWVEQKLGKAAGQFCRTLIAIADKYCGKSA
jgi:hypothetical protein